MKFPIFLTWKHHRRESRFIGKNTNTGLYVNYESFLLWTHRTAWIRSLVTRALKICSSNKLSKELKLIKMFASWNDFTKYIINSIFRKTLQSHRDKSEPNLTAKEKEPVITYFRFRHYGDKSLQLLKYCISKIKVNCRNDQKISYWCL